MKTTALELLMATYQQTGNQAKVVDTAKRVLTADACNLRALALLTFLARQGVASGTESAAEFVRLDSIFRQRPGMHAVRRPNRQVFPTPIMTSSKNKSA